MRIKQSEPIDVADGVRSVVEIDGETYWVDHLIAVTAEDVLAELLRRERGAALGEIERMAEARRETLTATGAGKRDAYLLKYELLLRAIKEDPDQEAIALLTAEAQARGTTLEAFGLVIAGKRKAWEQAAMAIETAEATAKREVSAAADRAAVDAAVAGARAAFAAIGG